MLALSRSSSSAALSPRLPTMLCVPMAGTKRRIKSADEPLVARALALAVEAVDRLPPNWQTGTDKTEMIAMLHHITTPGQADKLRLLARARLEQRGIEVVYGHPEL
jgi:hypothetical protein